MVDHLTRRERVGRSITTDAPLIAGPDGDPPGRATVAAARKRANAIIRAGSNLNVDLCRTTGEFFRQWGLPGSRFIPVDDLVTTSPREGGEPA